MGHLIFFSSGQCESICASNRPKRSRQCAGGER